MRTVDLVRRNLFSIGLVLFGLVTFAPENVRAQANTEVTVPAVQRILPGEPCRWDGFFLGVNVGGANYHSTASGNTVDVNLAEQFYENFGTIGVSETGTVFFNTPDTDRSENGAVGGGEFGFRKQFGNFVFGVSGDVQKSPSQQSSHFEDTGSTFITGNIFRNVFGETTFSEQRSVETNWNASGNAQFGYAWGKLLMYINGGVSFMDVTVHQTDVASTDFFNECQIIKAVCDGGSTAENPFQPVDAGGVFIGSATTKFNRSSSDVLTGWNAGTGFLYALSNMVSVGVEYRHEEFGGNNFGFKSNQDIIFPQNPIHADLNSDEVFFKISVLLGNFWGH